MQGIKIRCRTRSEARRVQILLRDEIGATWGPAACDIPWSTFRLWLIVTQSTRSGAWLISWVPERVFPGIPLPEWSALDLIAARPNATEPTMPTALKTRKLYTVCHTPAGTTDSRTVGHKAHLLPRKAAQRVIKRLRRAGVDAYAYPLMINLTTEQAARLDARYN